MPANLVQSILVHFPVKEMAEKCYSVQYATYNTVCLTYSVHYVLIIVIYLKKINVLTYHHLTIYLSDIKVHWLPLPMASRFFYPNVGQAMHNIF